MRQFKDKGHISYPQEKPQSTSTGGEGAGGQYGYITLRGGGGGACQTWIIYIYIYIYISMYNKTIMYNMYFDLSSAFRKAISWYQLEAHLILKTQKLTGPHLQIQTFFHVNHDGRLSLRTFPRAFLRLSLQSTRFA